MKVYHAGLGTREYYEECVAKTVRTVKRAAKKRSSNELKSGGKAKSEDSAKKTTKKTSPPPEAVEVGAKQSEIVRKTPKTAPKSVKIR